MSIKHWDPEGTGAALAVRSVTEVVTKASGPGT